MSNFADLLKAIAALLWPILGFVSLFLFKDQIKELLRRLKKGKILGQEVELEASLKELDKSAVAAAQEVSRLPLIEAAGQEMNLEPEGEGEILKIAAVSPKTALVALSGLIERESRDVLAISGYLNGRSNIPLQEAISEIETYRSLPPHIPGSLKYFREVRNRIVHGQGATDDDVIRAIDSGITILRALRAIPREINMVYHPGVSVYSDPEASALISDIKGVILETTSPDGAVKRHRIFPTTRTHYRKGQQVSWEWSMEHHWGTAWYRDPDTSEIKGAWLGSTEFVGRPLDTI